MPHNGGRSQIGLNFLGLGEYPFINRLKESADWVGSNGSTLLGEDRDVNGYPLRMDNLRNPSTNEVAADSLLKNQYARTETLAEYADPWVFGFRGKGQVGQIGSSFAPGFSAADRTHAADTLGFFEVYGKSDGLFEIQINSIPTAGEHPREMLLCRKDHYASYNSQKALESTVEPINPMFEAALLDLRPGYIRFLDWGKYNINSAALWDHRRRTTFWNYNCPEYRAEYLAPNLTTNVGDDYSLSYPGFGSLTHGKALIVRWNASAGSVNVTLDVTDPNTGISTGPLPVTHGNSGALFSTNQPVAFRYCWLVHDADLNCWVKNGGDAAQLMQGMPTMVPLEDCFNLCNRIGAHAWLPQPRMTLDAGTTTGTDWVLKTCELAEEMLDPGLKLVMQGLNESFNGLSGFWNRQYGYNKALAHWPAGGSSNIHNFCGKAHAIMFKTIHDYFADKGGTDRYENLIEVQTVAGLGSVSSSQDPKQTAADFVANDGGWNAWQYATGVCWANYWGPAKTTNELIASGYDTEFTGADAARQLELLDWYVGTSDPSAQATEMLNYGTNWAAWANKFTTLGTFCYEGGPSFDGLTSNATLVINGASKAAQCVLSVTTANMNGLVGRTVTPSAIVGMTELNGNTYTVVAVSGTNITIDVNSTGFTTYVSGGTLTMVGTQTSVNAMRLLAYRAPRCFPIMQQIHQKLKTISGFTSPSQFILVGNAAQAWGLSHGKMHNPDWSPGYDAIKLFNERKIRLTLRAP